MQTTHRLLMCHGMFLFRLARITGFAEPHFVNKRMGLAAHLEGVLNGSFLLALGAAWTAARLSAGAKADAFWAALYGLRELAGDDPGGGFRDRRFVAHHRTGPQDAAVAGARRHEIS